MRFLIKAKVPAESGNKIVNDPNFLTKLEEYINMIKPEAAYFASRWPEISGFHS